MNYNDALEYIHSLLRFGSRPGLERIRELLSFLGNPQNDLKFIHVAGTNGKGSVCTMLAEVLKTAGYKTGLYISPYVTCFRERIQVNGEYISESDLARLTAVVREKGIEVTEFEFITALAFLYFKEKGCDVIVLETGLGGRLDATNVINSPLACVITGIGLDHTAVLGDTLEEIAGEKCGIIKEGAPVFTTYNQPREAMGVIKRNSGVTVTDASALSFAESDISGNRFCYKGHSYQTGLIGAHQIENAMLVIDVLDGIGLNVSCDSVKKGISSARFAGRLELISQTPTVLMDGAHNPHGAAALVRELKNHKGIAMIIGMMADKACEEVVSMLAPLCKKIITVTVTDNPRAIDANELKEIASRYCRDVSAAQNYMEALEMTRGEDTVFIVGSLYLASSIRPFALDFYNSL